MRSGGTRRRLIRFVDTDPRRLPSLSPHMRLPPIDADLLMKAVDAEHLEKGQICLRNGYGDDDGFIIDGKVSLVRCR